MVDLPASTCPMGEVEVLAAVEGGIFLVVGRGRDVLLGLGLGLGRGGLVLDVHLLKFLRHLLGLGAGFASSLVGAGPPITNSFFAGGAPIANSSSPGARR